MWRERYALVEDGRELVTIEGKGCGQRPVKVTLQDAAAAIDPGLLLFAVFVVRTLAEDAGAAAGATAGAEGAAGPGGPAGARDSRAPCARMTIRIRQRRRL